MKNLTIARKIVQTRTRLVTRLIFFQYSSEYFSVLSVSTSLTAWKLQAGISTKKEAFERRTNIISLPILNDFS